MSDVTGQDALTTTTAQTSQTEAQTGEGTQQTDTTEKVFDAAYVRKLREEAKGYRLELESAKGKLTEFERAQLSEKEKLEAELGDYRKQIEDAKAAVQQAKAQTAITAAASKAGLPVELASRLIDVQFDDNGNPKGIEEAVASLVSQYPQLVSGGSSSAMNGASSRKRGLTADDLKKMTAEQISKLPPEEVNAALAR